MNIMKNFILIVLLILSHFVIASGVENNFNITQVAQGNYLHKGVHVSIDDINHDDIANIGFIVGDKCIAVIDTGGSVDIGLQLFEKIKSISDKPICYVINTHVHFDHMLGNKALPQKIRNLLVIKDSQLRLNEIENSFWNSLKTI